MAIRGWECTGENGGMCGGRGLGCGAGLYCFSGMSVFAGKILWACYLAVYPYIRRLRRLWISG